MYPLVLFWIIYLNHQARNSSSSFQSTYEAIHHILNSNHSKTIMVQFITSILSPLAAASTISAAATTTFPKPASSTAPQMHIFDGKMVRFERNRKPPSPYLPKHNINTTQRTLAKIRPKPVNQLQCSSLKTGPRSLMSY